MQLFVVVVVCRRRRRRRLRLAAADRLTVIARLVKTPNGQFDANNNCLHTPPCWEHPEIIGYSQKALYDLCGVCFVHFDLSQLVNHQESKYLGANVITCVLVCFTF